MIKSFYHKYKAVATVTDSRFEASVGEAVKKTSAALARVESITTRLEYLAKQITFSQLDIPIGPVGVRPEEYVEILKSPEVNIDIGSGVVTIFGFQIVVNQHLPPLA